MKKDKKHRDRFNKKAIDYLQGKLSKEEQYAFEKQINADDFDFEALAGLENYTPDELEQDLEEIQDRLAKKNTKKAISPWYAVAAAISLLIIGFSTWYFIDQTPQARQLADQPEEMMQEKKDFLKQPELQKADKTESQELEPSQNEKENMTPSGRKNSDEIQPISESEPTKIEKSFDELIVEEIQAADGFTEEEVAMPQITPEIKTLKTSSEPEALAREEINQTRRSIAANTKKQNNNIIRGRILDAETNEPIPGATVQVEGTNTGTVTDMEGKFTLTPENDLNTGSLTIGYIGYADEHVPVKDSMLEIHLSPDLLALDEVVVVGYGVEKKSHATGAISSIEMDNEYAENNNRRAQPLDGYIAFRRYIKENIRVPDEKTGDDKYTVDLRLHINPQGAIESIDIIESPGDKYTEEAKRLIQEGPKWIPKLNNGTPVSSEVKIKIKFKE